MALLSKSNLFMMGLIGYLCYDYYPTYRFNSQLEGKELSTTGMSYVGSKTDKTFGFPIEGRKQVIIVWSYDCGPCRLEMKRITDSIESGEIPKENVFAISPKDDNALIERFTEINKFPFYFLKKNKWSEELKIFHLPTILLVDGKRVVHATSGLSVYAIWRAESFINNKFFF